MSEAREESHVARTDAGMCAVWQPDHFAGISGYEDWDAQLGEDHLVAARIRDGVLVPLNVGGDGAFQVLVRFGDGLADRETRYRTVSSKPYLLVSRGRIALGGLEQVGDEDAVTIGLEPGRYEAVVHLIAWDDEPGAKNPDGSPADHALPDFVVVVGPAGDGPFRESTETFDRP